MDVTNLKIAAIGGSAVATATAFGETIAEAIANVWPGWALDGYVLLERFGVDLRSDMDADQEERPKYDPCGARLMWDKTYPKPRAYREKRPLRMVRHNPVAASRPNNGRRGKR